LNDKTISRSTIWLYGSLGLPLALLGYPLGIWLPRAYDTYIGVETALVGTIIAAAAIFDALTDPAVGFLSDKMRTRWGRRKSWVTLGTPFLALALYFILNPDSSNTVLYLAFWFVFLRVGTTLVGVPYAAWGAELSSNYHTRTRIMSAHQVFILLGLIGAAAIPAIVELIHGDDTTAVMVLNAYTIPVMILLPVTVLLLLWRVPEPPRTIREGTVGFTQSLTLMWRNKLFLRLISIELLVNGGEAFRNTLSLYFMQDYIGAPRAGMLYLLYFAMGLSAIPVWNLLARRFGKHRSLSGAIIFVCATNVAMFMLDYGQVWEFYFLFALKGFCFGAFAYLPRAMMADVIDVDTVKSGDARSGSYFAVLGFTSKLALSVGGASLILLALVGYQTAQGAVNTPEALTWLGFLYAIVPTMSLLAALYLCWTWPMTSELHAKLERILIRRGVRPMTAPSAPPAAEPATKSSAEEPHPSTG
jgi:glycoside/pentoside/hexuronide:cation symporter, GPH family